MKLTLELPKEKEQTEEERATYCSAIFAIFPRLESDIKEKMYEQLITTYSIGVGMTKNKEERDFEIVRGNGIMEGMAILLESWRQAEAEHRANSKPEESYDKSLPLAEV